MLSIWPWRLFKLLVSLLIDAVLWSFDQNRSGPKVDVSGSKKHVLRAKKHKLFGTRVVHFWTRIWSVWGEGLRVGSETWDDGNTTNGDGDRSWCPDRRASYIFDGIFWPKVKSLLSFKGIKLGFNHYFRMEQLTEIDLKQLSIWWKSKREMYDLLSHDGGCIYLPSNFPMLLTSEGGYR